ncbi:hypothetical protein BKA65DRAFT_272959 [Rhexocercosporidium sp. MPI-PUGE-AT-0058]|nr:hypothetical protein BKA65DRAFT_272959 [Rhexocercosporidium sp. MPI-PUGE-AT-0058]
MRQNLTKEVFNLQTQTQVTSVTKSTRDPRQWTVHTSDRGIITCSQVVHATKAYSSAIEPSLYGIITLHPHICTKVIPSSIFTRPEKTCRIRMECYWMTGQCIVSIRGDGIARFGSSNSGQKNFNDWLKTHPERWIDDGRSGEEFVTPSVEKFAEEGFVRCVNVEKGQGAV